MIRYANVDGQLREPVMGLKGICPGCNKSLIAKCGLIKIHHWAHKGRIDCDPWWEHITQWHLDWQNNFAPEWREVIFQDDRSGEIHRADIHTPKGVTIEFQHSPLSLKEFESRNTFYKKLIWVVNAQPFEEYFIFTNATPNPQSPLLANYNFVVDTKGFAKSPRFYIKDEYKWNGQKRLLRSFTLEDHELRSVAEEYGKSKKLYWLFNWNNKRGEWLKSGAPVFLDFGNESLYLIRQRQQEPTSLLYLQVVGKKDFLAKYVNQADN
ncbi:MAG: Competence protein CoiA-like family protein [Mucilaginibacter sp.]|nr:Competence protein CoiA-like family protein [Mucilaginibacter sp.]